MVHKQTMQENEEECTYLLDNHSPKRVSFVEAGAEDSSVWFIVSEIGVSLSLVVWAVLLFAEFTLIYTIKHHYVGEIHGVILSIMIVMALWCHLKAMFSDPGAVPKNAEPVPGDTDRSRIRCGRCQCYKPPLAHHDHLSKRCVSRMDHYCPWVNNVIGLKNQKHFLLFLMYTDAAAIYLYVLFIIHLNYCDNIGCTAMDGTSEILTWVVTISMIFVMLFATYILVNQYIGFSLGMGTIDRMKLSRELGGRYVHREPTPWVHIFGFQPWYTYFVPVDPDFRDDDEVFRYRVPPPPGPL